MKRFVCVALAGAGLTAFSQAARADLTYDFSTNPLTDPTVLVQGPDAANAATRFTYNAAAGTLTAHYDTTAPTIQLLFPLGQHFTQNQSFQFTCTFTILSNGYTSPPDFGGAAPSFGLVNSATTGSIRASTGYYPPPDYNFVEVTPGNSYDLMTFDYFPTQDTTYGGNSINLTTIHTAGAGFDNSFNFGYQNATLPFDQTITVTANYDAATQTGSLDWGTGSLTSDMTGAIFDVDSFAILLWNDPNLAPDAPADPAGSPVGGDVVFDSFSVQAVPEPASLAVLALGALVFAGRRRR